MAIFSIITFGHLALNMVIKNLIFKPLVIILIFAMLSVSCSTINFATKPDLSEKYYIMLNDSGKKYPSIISLISGEIIKSNYVDIQNDVLKFENKNDTLSVPINQIEKIVIKRGVVALVSGLGLALISFVLATKIAFNNSADIDSSIKFGVISSISSFIFGVGFCGDTEYIFNGNANYEQSEYYKNYQKIKAKRDTINLGTN